MKFYVCATVQSAFPTPTQPLTHLSLKHPTHTTRLTTTLYVLRNCVRDCTAERTTASPPQPTPRCLTPLITHLSNTARQHLHSHRLLRQVGGRGGQTATMIYDNTAFRRQTNVLRIGWSQGGHFVWLELCSVKPPSDAHETHPSTHFLGC